MPNRILIIENDEVIAATEVKALEEAGYEVIRGFDILDGLKKLYEFYPDLIVMDRELPVIGREDPCLRIRQASYIPIIALGSEEYSMETLEIGADAYMARPPSLVELVARVNSLLRRKQKDKPQDENHTPDDGNHLLKT
jgi:DNA-binding response OmpR family regulator